MRACAQCGYGNPASLAYCFQCGRRLGRNGGAAGAIDGGTVPRPSGLGLAEGGGAADTATSVTTGFAATLALSSAARRRQGAASAAPRPLRAFAAAWQALTYLFAYVRGRIHAEDRKRSLAEERRGAQGLIDAALAELGAAAIAGPEPPAELAEVARAVATARQRREGAAADLANAERLQAAADLRLGLDQAAAESEWKACARGVEELDRMLRELEEERRRLDGSGERAPPGGGADTAHPGDRRATEERRAQLTEEVSTLRERAAALRASTTAARSKLDHATAARRTSAAALAAGLAAQTRARADADRALSQAIADAGQRALALRLPRPELLPRYDRIDRLRQTIADAERAVGNLDRHLGGYDNRKLATGAMILAGLLVMTAGIIWALAK